MNDRQAAAAAAAARRPYLQDPARVGGVAVRPVVTVALLRRQILGVLHLWCGVHVSWMSGQEEGW